MAIRRWFSSLLPAILLLLAVCAPHMALAAPPFTLPKAAELSRLRSAQIRTSKGDIFVELYPEDAPWHVANFKYRADRGFYRQTAFHLFFPGYIIQGGEAPASLKVPPYSLPPEFNSRRHIQGALGMARKQDVINPERRSDGEQFHLLLADAPHMDGKYTVFGRVTKGLAVMERLAKGDVIRDVEVFVRAAEQVQN